MKQKKDSKNYLDKIPAHAADRPFSVDENGIVEITMENKGFYNTIAQNFFHRPRYSFISLDEYGSFVWQQIDGKTTIYEIGKKLEETHEGAKEKLYERLSAYFGILETNKFITFVE